MLINNGGTVCDDGFSANSADAVCQEMGYLGHSTWTNGDKHKWIIQLGLPITLGGVQCTSSEWISCSFTFLHGCVGHDKDVYLQCYGPGM